MKANCEIRERAKKAGCYLWQIAGQLGMSDTAFSKKLRCELPQEEKRKILAIIDRVAMESKEVQ